jgi:putative membrane protein
MPATFEQLAPRARASDPPVPLARATAFALPRRDWTSGAGWIFLLGLGAWSAYRPVNPVVWVFEAAPAAGLMLLLLWCERHWRLTPLAHGLITLGAALMLVGAHYTYAGMPLFTLLQDAWQLDRNHYDRFGHIFQGLIPAVLLREYLLRQSTLKRGALLTWLVASCCLAIAAFWEIVEWCAVVWAGGSPDVYLSFQGDPWDSQSDIACALVGAWSALLLLARVHDRQLDRLHER